MERKRLGWVAIALAVGGVGYWAGNARADGIPTTNPLTYAGTLQDAAGAPQAGVSVSLSLWDNVSAGAKQCDGAAPGVTDAAGHFSIALAAPCVPVVHGIPDLWVELVAGTTTLPRTKVGAVPYAVEAERAGTVLRHVLIKNSKQYSLDATFCGATGNTTGAISGGGLTGYAAAKNLCETACGSPSAHMCTGAELVRTNAMGIATNTANYFFAGGIASNVAAANKLNQDCNGYTDGTATWAGSVWYTAAPGFWTCDAARPVACCD